jgi:LVIVD repeat-containing protein
MTRLSIVLALLLVGVCALPPAGAAQIAVGPGGGTPGTAKNFKMIGHDPIFARGMNAAPAIFGDFLYVGNRTDGSTSCGVDESGEPIPGECTHPHAGIAIVDIGHSSNPTVVGEIGPPYAGLPGITTRELRVWPEKKLLMVMTFNCSAQLHACAPTPAGAPSRDAAFPFDIKFFDLSDPRHPRFLSSYVPTSTAGEEVKPHEMFLWVDPKDEDRALLWVSTPSTSADPDRPNLMVVDISEVAEGGEVTEVAEGNWNQLYPGAEDPANYDSDLSVHSMGVSADGTRTHLAYLRGHYLILDTTEVVHSMRPGEVISLNDNLLTAPDDRPMWGTTSSGCVDECAESHSAVEVPGRRLAFTTDEVYGTFTDPSHGCPWGWARLIDTADPSHPTIVSEYRIPQNTRSFCGSPEDDPATEQFTSYASHNPTVLRKLALVTWHSGGLQAIDISNPRRPTQSGWFSPTPLADVATEDPALSRGPNKVVMWSYPIIKDGLIYVVDVRNGLYVLRYKGRRQRQVKRVDFFEGNSNLGDALKLAGVGPH